MGATDDEDVPAPEGDDDVPASGESANEATDESVEDWKTGLSESDVEVLSGMVTESKVTDDVLVGLKSMFLGAGADSDNRIATSALLDSLREGSDEDDIETQTLIDIIDKLGLDTLGLV